MNSPNLTLGQASQQVGCSKATLSKALKNGAISGTKRGDGSFSIEPAELMRWNGERSQRGQRFRTKTVNETSKTQPENGPLQAKDELISELRQIIDDLRGDRDEWRKQAQQLALVDHSHDNAGTAAQEIAERSQTVWQWLGLAKA